MERVSKHVTLSWISSKPHSSETQAYCINFGEIQRNPKFQILVIITNKEHLHQHDDLYIKGRREPKTHRGSK